MEITSSEIKLDEDNKKASNNEPCFKIISEATVYRRYLKVVDRLVEFPNQEKIHWDIVEHSFNDSHLFVCIFPFDLKTKTTTLIREYCQGTNSMSFGLPCGHFDRDHHKDLLHAAECELSEEAQLKTEIMINLLPPENSEGILEIKWGSNRFIPFLALDPISDVKPLPKDKEGPTCAYEIIA